MKQFLPTAGEKGLELKNIGQRLILIHIMADEFKEAVGIRAAKQVNELRSSSAGIQHIVAGMLDIEQGIPFIDLDDLIDEPCELSALAAAYKELEGVPVVVNVIDEGMDIAEVFLTEDLIVE